ncbi:helix-hairpin-helix domain-containing protein [Salinibacillus xinjiangensis]|uniref:Helix-hairpin-helix DNA-binding motif class 1 domain-containing protein n=1 Tax=Salinibacillus xinjiangensis TaxID=1229268 RepID=A0A6G1X6V6_9BACI|nr:helix-hairpin-helix domain-containing protein [Salinibacillus xinjiangensis]MRG86659.1 hypothetical protein [Salinibacillus xinjiangensis]
MKEGRIKKVKVNKRILFKLWIGFILVIFVLVVVMTNRGEEAEVEQVILEKEPDVKVEEDSLGKSENFEVEQVKVDVKGAVHHPGVYQLSSDARVNDALTLAGGMTEQADPLSVNLAERVYDEMAIVVLKANEEVEYTTINEKSGKIRINHALVQDLLTLPGIGPAKAEAIIQYREENGPFQSKDDIVNVTGIGEKTLEKFIDKITVP